MNALYLLAICLSAFVFTVGLTALAVLLLRRLQIVDQPNERSNHQQPVPRGGGIAVIFTLISFLMVAGASSHLLWAAFGLMVIGFTDDLYRISIRYRLPVQIGAVLLALLPLEGLVFQGLLPLFADRLLAGLLLFGFLNLYNFMDGIDGITGMQTAMIGLGLSVLWMSTDGIQLRLAADGLVLISVAVGFLVFNWHPARVFLGDSGSTPLGLILGFLLLQVAAQGYWAAALILPAYYLTDSILTFISRLMKGEKVWQAHSRHGYQRAVRRGMPHNEVVRVLFVFNIIAIVLMVISLKPLLAVPAILIAYLLAFALRTYFRTVKIAKKAPEPTGEAVPLTEAEAPATNSG